MTLFMLSKKTKKMSEVSIGFPVPFSETEWQKAKEQAQKREKELEDIKRARDEFLKGES